MRLPRHNDRVYVVRPGDEQRLFSRVEELRHGDTVVIAPPAHDGRVVQLAVGEAAAIEWTSARGLLRGDGVVVDRSAEPLPVVSVRLDSSYLAQRRDHVRVELVLDVELREPEGEPVSCRTIDVSGGGMRAFVPLELRPGAVVSATLALPEGGPVKVEAEVIRGSAATGYAFRYAAVDRDERERLIRFVFAAHCREFAAVRRTA